MRFIARKKILFLILLFVFSSIQVLAGPLELAPDGKVLPFERVNYPVLDFIKEYANVTGIRVTYPDRMINKREKVNLIVKNPITKEKLTDYFVGALGDRLTAINIAGGMAIIHAREVRYNTFKVYPSTDFPKTNQYITVLHRLKYPLAQSISRRSRSTLSRYGQLIHLPDQKTIIFKDKGNMIGNAISLIKYQDSEESYQNYLARREKSAIGKRDRGKLQKKIDELKEELEKSNKERRSLEKKIKNRREDKAQKNNVKRPAKKSKGGRNVV